MTKFALLDHMGFGNLGDAAIQNAVIQNLRERDTHVQFVLVSLNPADSIERHGHTAWPITWRAMPTANGSVCTPSDSETVGSRPEKVPADRPIRRFLRRHKFIDSLFARIWILRQELRFIVKYQRKLRECDLLIISGGGQIDDSWGGPRGAPLNLLRWAVLARLSRIPLIFLGVGAGPLHEARSRKYCRIALRFAHHVTFRDAESLDFAKSIGFNHDARIIPDLAYGLLIQTDQRRSPDPAGCLDVGICPIPYMDPRWWPDRDLAMYETYISAIAIFAAQLIDRGHTIRFLVGDINMDRTAVCDLRDTIERLSPALNTEKMVEMPIRTVEELVDQLTCSDIVISSRFHGVLLAQLLQKPVLAVSYHGKIDSLMKSMGQGRYVVPIDSFNADDLVRRFDAIVENIDEIRTSLQSRIENHRSTLAPVFDEILKFRGD